MSKRWTTGWRAWGIQGRASKTPSHRGTRRTHRNGVAAGQLECLEPRQLMVGDLRIAEVMVDNNKTIDDEDGVPSDWFEVYNAGHETINLQGWSVTDDVRDRTKWSFNGGSLQPGDSLLVFASSKDRRGTNGEFHTNFKLAEGDYLAIVEPDGITISDVYQSIPSQYEDISYGVSQTLTDRTLVGANSKLQVLFPSSAAQDVATSSWTAADYNAANWRSMTNGIGYDADPLDGDFNPLISANGNASSMRNATASAYIRSEFTMADPLPTISSLNLGMNYDDGFIAYLNGQPVARVNAPEAAAWNSTATQTHGGVGAALTYADFSNADDRDDYTLKGNASFNGAKLQLTAAAADQTSAAWLTKPVAFGSDYTFQASMVYDIHSPGGETGDRDGRGGEGITFVLQATDNNVLGGGRGSLGLDGSGATFLAIELDSGATGAFDPDDSLPSHLGIDTSAVGNVARVAVPRFNGNAFFPGQPGPGVNFVYLWVDYVGATQTLDVYMATSNSKPAAPTLSTKVNLNELFGDISNLYTGWTSTTSATYNAHEVVRWDMRTGVGELGRDVENFDLSNYIHLLKPGKNVFAIHGLNTQAGDEDFLIVPQLSVGEISVGDVGYFATPTPGALNGLSALAPSGSVTFSRDSGLFVDNFSVTLSGPTANSTIYYTLDGTIPTEASTLYTQPIVVDTAYKRIRARAIEPGRSLGPISTVGYTKVDAALTNFEDGHQFESNLPLMVFQAFGLNPDTNAARLIPTMAYFIDPGADGKATLMETPTYTGRAGLRIRGQSSEGWPKHQYALELWAEGNDDSKAIASSGAADKDVSLFGLPADSDWVLNGPYSDKTQLNNFISFQWAREMGLEAPRTRIVEVFVQTKKDSPLDFNDDYRGTYVLLEKIKISKDRVNIAKLEPGDVGASEITGGYIWKKDKPGAGDRPFTTLYGQEIRVVEPQDPISTTDIRPGEITPEQKDWLRNYLNEFETVLYGPDFADPQKGYAKYIDVDSWVNTWLLVEFTKNIDGFRLSTYYYKDRGGKIKQGPVWDYNLSFGNANYLHGAFPEGWYKDEPDMGNDIIYPYWRRLFQDPNFAQKISDRWNELRKTVFAPDKMMADIDRGVNLLSNGNPNLSKPAAGEPSNPISRNYARWTNAGYGEGVYHWPNCYFGVDVCPASPLPKEMTPNGRPDSYDDYIYLMRRFIKLRSEWIDKQFAVPVSLTPDSGVVEKGTQVTMSGPVGYDLFYTTDGTDPRQPLVLREDAVMLPAGSPAKVIVPANDTLIGFCDDGTRLTTPASCFVNPVYVLGTNNETWTDAQLPIGYDTGTDYDALIKTDLQSQMKDVNSTAYLRIPFNVDATVLKNSGSLRLSARYEDGFVAYIWSASNRNVIEIARSNASGRFTYPIKALPYNATATSTHADEYAIRWEDFDVSAALRYLKAGENFLIIQALNESAASDDFLFDVQLVATTLREEASPSVKKYEGPLTIERNTQIIARAYNPSTKQWSNREVANYVVDVPVLSVTEINYNPYPPTPAEMFAIPTLDNDDFEYLEIKNIGSSKTSLVGLTFTGFDLTLEDVELAPGEYGVVVANTEAFRVRYGNGPKILGEFFDGGLNNGGEAISIASILGPTLLELSYSDSAIWPQAADGNGASLQLRDETFTGLDQLGKYYVWRASTEYGGSPGRAGAAPLGVVINEVLSHTDAPVVHTDSIELYNPTNQPINIGGWYLSDSGVNPLKYAIPANTILGAGQYLVFTENEFNRDPNNGFALQGTGDDVWLVTAENGQVKQIADDVHFGAAINGESFGRVPNGRGWMTPLKQIELGAANTEARVGPVIISELNYNPGEPSEAALAIDPNLTSGDLEFIEIYNPTNAVLNLEDWRVRGGVSMNFAPTDSLGAGRAAIIVSFNPESPDNAKRLEAFRKQYNLDTNVVIYGGYSGQLSGSGERVTLQRPDKSIPSPVNGYPSVISDEVIFDDRAPWPTAADGLGKTLHRQGLSLYGNSADSWAAFDATPGAATFAPTKGDFNGDGSVDTADIGLLFGALRAGSVDPNFDLNGDRLINTGDRDFLITKILNTSYGDADLDGIFDSQDLVKIFQINQYEDTIANNSVWQTGDWDGDGEFSTTDLLLAIQAGGYVAFHDDELAAVAAGPAPTAIALAIADGVDVGADDEVIDDLGADPTLTSATIVQPFDQLVIFDDEDATTNPSVSETSEASIVDDELLALLVE